ncbi:hypothetical protein B0H19DRAFT_1013686 [Mycena capillaripes]|nr:hypothetical protein B0H19DRAFT_1013686 [Mycena capillaripes]
MHLSFLSVFVFLAVPLRVIACEGDCIVGVTQTWMGNYSEPVNYVLSQLGQEVINKLLPGSTRISPASLMEPIFTAYNNDSYSAFERAIFPSFFHGKCLDSKGVEPAGCPNPDCRIVCGTPGSLIHFYSTLRFICFKTARDRLISSMQPNTSSYLAVEKIVTREMTLQRGPGPRMLRYRRSFISEDDEPSASPVAQKDIASILQNTLDEASERLQKRCGGDGLQRCSWETEMKPYILSFP